MLIRIIHPDQNSTSRQRLTIPLLMLEAMSFSQTSYAAIDTVFGV